MDNRKPDPPPLPWRQRLWELRWLAVLLGALLGWAVVAGYGEALLVYPLFVAGVGLVVLLLFGLAFLLRRLEAVIRGGPSRRG
jgi:hypothetical protein